ncbi:MAG: DUF4932 domain-containing protein [bacterium]
MKKQTIISLLVLLFSASISANTDNITFGVDERYEFSSIVWKLAGAAEYNKCYVPVYVEAVEDYFKDYMDHPLIEYCKELRAKQRIAHSAVSQGAMFMEIVDGRVKIREGYDANDITLASYRWTPESYVRYLELIDSFYEETKFHEFFESQKSVYSEAEYFFERLLLNDISTSYPWFNSYFGTQNNTIHINLGIMNGSSNYAVIGDENYDICLLFGCCFSYEDKVALYHKRSTYILAHEIMHNLANPIAEKYTEEFDSIITRIYPYVKYDLAMASYGEDDIIDEWFTRLLTLMYAKDNGYDDSVIESNVKLDSTQGFVWQKAAFAYMDKFEQNRDKYPLIEDFMPELVTFLDTLSQNIEQYVDVSFEVPRVISVTPDTNAVYLYADIDTFIVEIVFSEKMEYAVAFGLMAEDVEAANNVFREECAKHDINWMFNELMRWESQSVIQIRLTKQLLIDSKCTGIKLSKAYKSIMGVHLEDDVFLNYNFK